MRKFSFSEEMQAAVSCYFGMLLPVIKTQKPIAEYYVFKENTGISQSWTTYLVYLKI